MKLNNSLFAVSYTAISYICILLLSFYNPFQKDTYKNKGKRNVSTFTNDEIDNSTCTFQHLSIYSFRVYILYTKKVRQYIVCVVNHVI